MTLRTVDRSGAHIRATAAGRVNLIGDHVDYMGGPVLPMAIGLATTVDVEVGDALVDLRSEGEPEPARFDLPVGDPRAVRPDWARYVAAVAAGLHTDVGIRGHVTSTLPAGAGLSSSAALEVVVALALGAEGPPVDLALACQRAEHAATGVPSGIMDQLCICAATAGHATFIDCEALTVEQVRVPDSATVWVVHSGQARALTGSAYAERREAAEAAAAVVGPLPTADPAAIEALADPVLRRRARHVRTESGAVLAFREALVADDLVAAGELMSDSHRSLRDDCEVSTRVLDGLVEELCAIPGVHGARVTGAGFGGCAVALAEHGVDVLALLGGRYRGWQVCPSDGTALTVS